MRSRSPTTIRYCISLLKFALGSAVAQGELATNPCESVSVTEAQEGSCSRTEARSTDRAPQAWKETRFYPLAVLAAGIGMRRREMLALRWSDIDLDARRISVRRSLEQTAPLGVVERAPKSASSNRDISISEGLVRFLRDYRRQSAEEALGTGVRLTRDAGVFHTLPDVEKPWKTLTRFPGSSGNPRSAATSM